MPKKSITIACATNDEINFYRGHFGDANLYVIYEINESCIAKKTVIKNKFKEDELHSHGDKKKANSITKELKKFGVNILSNKNFGKNLIKMKENFIIVIVKGNYSISEVLKKIIIMFSDLSKLLNNPPYKIIHIK